MRSSNPFCLCWRQARDHHARDRGCPGYRFKADLSIIRAMQYAKSCRSRTATLIALAFCLATPLIAFGQAQKSAEQEAEPIEYPPRYQVELIVFRQLDPAPGNEQFAPPYDPFATATLDELDALLSGIGDPDDFAWLDPTTIADPLADLPADDEDEARFSDEDLASEAPGELATELEDAEEPEPRREPQIIEDEEQWQLADLIERINDSKYFQLLAYQVWQQDGVLFDETEPFVLQTLNNDEGLLEGTATLSLSRFLHLLLEIDWLPREKNEGFSLYPGLAGLVAKPTPYTISESRLMQRGDIHYFDHPLFGVVALVTRVEEPESELDEDGNPIAPVDAAAAATS